MSTTSEPDPVATATFVLALITVCAIVVPILSANFERHRRAISGLQQLSLLVRFVRNRLQAVAANQNANPAVLIDGVDVALERIFAQDVTLLFRDPHAAETVYAQIGNGHQSFAMSVSARSAYTNPAIAQQPAQEGAASLQNALDGIETRLEAVRSKNVFVVLIGL